MSKGWDSATLKKLKALTGKGLSTSEIGKRLGLSKNAVVGKLNRLGWNSKANATADKAPAKPAAKPAAKKAPAKPVTKATTVKKVATKTTEKAKTTTPKKVAAKPATKPVAKKVAEKPAPKTTKATEKKSAPKATKTSPATTKAAAKKPATDKKDLNKNLAMHQRIIQHSLEMANLKPNQCRWPIGDPDSEHFHFCGETVFVGKPYCYEHCRQAYQFTPPKKK